MGVVYLAEDKILGRRVALKVLPAGLSLDESFVSRFREEAKVIASISHPNVVHIHTFEVIEGVPVIEMEYIEGGSLSRKLHRESVATGDIVHYACEIASALSYCHSLKAVHRDVKPSNILIDALNRARLADFGIAKALADWEMTSLSFSSSGFQGTPLYAPPEAWDGQAPSRAWDIYGLGAVMYEGLTGAPPYDAGTPLQLVKRIASAPVSPVKEMNPTVSNELAAVVDEMLSVDPAARPADAEEVRKRLECTPEFQSVGASEMAMASTVQRRPPKTRRATQNRGRRRVIFASVLLGILAAFGALLYFSGPPARSTGPEPARRASAIKAAASSPRVSREDANLSVDELLNMSKDPESTPSVVLDVRSQSSPPRAPENWLVTLSAEGEPTKILAFGEATLASLFLDKREGSEEYAASGNWARYADANGTVLRYGTVSGSLRWRARPPEFLGFLTYVTEQDGAAQEAAIGAGEHAAIRTDSQFLFQMESSERVQPLLYAELIPRSLTWAHEAAEAFPCFRGGSVDVTDTVSETAGMRIDGVLDEAAWASTPERHRLHGAPESRRPVAWFAYSPDALFIAVQCADAGPPDSLSLELRLLSRYVVPLSASPHLWVTHFPSEGATLEHYGTHDAEAKGGGSEFASGLAGGVWTAEGRIPFSSLRQQAKAMTPEVYWRFNAALYRRRHPDESELLCRWGFADETAVAHGAVLHLKTSESRAEAHLANNDETR